MKIYADSSFMVRLLVRDRDTDSAVASFRSLGRPSLAYTQLHELEIPNAIRLRSFHVLRHLGDKNRSSVIREEREALARLETFLTRKAFTRTSTPLDDAFKVALELSTVHARKIGLRSMDLLHVALAMELHSEMFVTSDSRQATLAKSSKMKVIQVYSSE